LSESRPSFRVPRSVYSCHRWTENGEISAGESAARANLIRPDRSRSAAFAIWLDFQANTTGGQPLSAEYRPIAARLIPRLRSRELGRVRGEWRKKRSAVPRRAPFGDDKLRPALGCLIVNKLRGFTARPSLAEWRWRGENPVSRNGKRHESRSAAGREYSSRLCPLLREKKRGKKAREKDQEREREREREILSDRSCR